MSRSKSRIVEVSATHTLDDGAEVELLVRVEVEGYDAPARYSSWGWEPPESREARVVEVVVDAPGYPARPAFLAAYENDGRILDLALEQDERDDREAYEVEMERRSDAARDERMLGGRP